MLIAYEMGGIMEGKGLGKDSGFNLCRGDMVHGAVMD